MDLRSQTLILKRNTMHGRQTPKPLFDVFRKTALRNTHTFTIIASIQRRDSMIARVGYVYPLEYDIMASKGFDWTFVNIKLVEKDKSKVSKFLERYPDDIVEIIDDITELGYKVSVSWVDSSNSYCVSVSGNENTPQNNKCTITSWSGVLQEAIAIAGYKVLDLLDGEKWTDHETEASNWG